MIQRGFYGNTLVYVYSPDNQTVRFYGPMTGYLLDLETVYTASSANRWLLENLEEYGLKPADLRFEEI